MTQEEAQALADQFNIDLGTGTATALYKVFVYWLPDYLKVYGVTLVPTTYETQYNSATDSLEIAFQRVSSKALALPNDGLADYVTNFQAVATNDAELADYLGL